MFLGLKEMQVHVAQLLQLAAGNDEPATHHPLLPTACLGKPRHDNLDWHPCTPFCGNFCGNSGCSTTESILFFQGNSMTSLHGMQEVRGSSPLSSTLSLR